jgi:hypothetical protein
MKTTFFPVIVLLLLALSVQDAMSQADIQAISVLSPQNGDMKPQKNTFEISASFKNVGSIFVPHFAIFTSIYDLSNNKLVFTSGSQIENLYPDSTKVVNFLSANGQFDVRAIPIGSYRIKIFAITSQNDPKKNDTCYATFSISSGIAPNDLSINEISSPINNTNLPRDTTISFIARIGNSGMNSESNVPVKLVVKNRDSVVVYSDITTINSVIPGISSPLVFKPFKCPPGSFVARAYPMLPNEDYFKDDTCWCGFSAGLANDFEIASIRTPQLNESLDLGFSFHPIITIRWAAYAKPPSSLTVRYQIFSMGDPDAILTIDTIIKKPSSIESTLLLPSSQKLMDTKNLSVGYYMLKVFSMLSDDDDRTNDTLSIPFRIGFRTTSKNVALLHLSPSDNQQLSINIEYPISVRAYNAGTILLENMEVIGTIKNRKNNILYQDTISIKSLYPNQFLDLTFPPHALNEKDIFLIQAATEISGDENPSDNLLQSHVTTSLPDIGFIKVLSPSNGQHIPLGTGIIPSCSVQLSPRWEPIIYEPLQIVVADSATNAVRYIGFTVIPFLDTNIAPQRIYFPTSMAGLNMASIPPGTYKIYFIISPSDDVNRHNDTISSYFTIYDPSNYDIKLISITDPEPNAALQRGSMLSPTVKLQWTSKEQTLENIPVRLEIRATGKNEIIFYQNATIKQLNKGEPTAFTFKPILLEQSGCYTVKIFSRLSIDPDRSNDTATSNFCIESLSAESNGHSDTFNLSTVPNPCFGSTTLHYFLPVAGTIHIRIYDIAGSVVQKFLISAEAEGEHNQVISLHSFSTGNYMAELEYISSNGSTYKKRIPIIYRK